MTMCFTRYLVQNFNDLKVECDDDVFHELPRQKLNDLKVECDDEVFHEVPRQKFSQTRRCATRRRNHFLPK